MNAQLGHNGGPQLLDLDIATPAVFEPLLHPSRYKAAHGGRGSGKSHFFAEMIVEKCVLQPGLRVVCIREVQLTLAQSVYQLIVDKIDRLGVSSLFTIHKNEIITPGGGIIIFRGMQSYNADSIKSLEGFDIAFVEEAQTLSEHSLRLLRPTIRKEGSELWFAWNPRYPDDPVDNFFRGGEAPPRSIVIEANYSDNPFFPPDLKEEREFDLRRDKELHDHVWGGEYVNQSNARVFRNFEEREFDAPEGTIFYLGADWGFSKDPSVLVRMFIVGRTIFVDHEAYAVGCEIDQTPFLFGGAKVPVLRKMNEAAYRSMTPQQRKDWWEGVPKALDFTIRADSARPETISYMQKHGFPRMVAAVKGAGSVEEGVKFLQSYKIVVHPRCKHTLAELRHYSYKIDPHTEEVTSVLADKKNHVIDAMRYALEEVRRKIKTTTQQGLPI